MSTSVARAFAIAEHLYAARAPQTLMEIARAVGAPPSTTHGLLATLLELGAVERSPGKRYHVGPLFFVIGAKYARTTPLYRAIWDDLVGIANEHDVNAALAITQGDHHAILAVHQNTAPKIQIGGRIPLDAGSFGATYSAWNVEPPIRGERQATKGSVGFSESERSETRRRGYAVDRGAFAEGIGAVATAVTSTSGYEGIASLIAGLERFDAAGFDSVGAKLAILAETASRILGDASRERSFGDESASVLSSR
jgi:DNA-binding IclR family transcriptional regulator